MPLSPDNDAAPNELANITIKAVPTEVWKRARDAADRQGLTMGAWITQAIDRLVADARDERAAVPEVRETSSSGTASASAMEAAVSVEVLMRAVAATSQASGTPFPKTASDQAFAILDQHLRALLRQADDLGLQGARSE